AQPQHTRDDSHFFLGPRASLLEKYVDGNIGLFALDGASLPPVFRVRDLWATATGALMTGFGLAEFSNMNFVSAGTNFTERRTGATADQFPSPTLNLGDARGSSQGDSCQDGARAPGAPGSLTFFGNAFPDPVTHVTLPNPRMTTESIFDQYLVDLGLPSIFALNCF